MSPGGPAEQERGGSVLGSSAVMAAGTVVSRLSGFVRGTLLAAALGTGLHADVFNIANTVPNMLYILLAGGVFNAVLVPQLVRAMKNDPDGGDAYTSRVITLAAIFLGVVSVVLVVAAPLVMRVLLDGSYFTPQLAAQRESVIAFARYCLPQVFFYGMFVLVGQVLNARGRFGPMMWAPIANNVISVIVLVIYLLTIGAAHDVCNNPGVHVAPHNSVLGPFSGRQEALLGLGSTLGIAVQLLVLLPYLKAAGFSFRPRFDFRNTGLGHTLRLGIWTVLFVVVNQVAYTVVVRIASSGTAESVGATCSTAASQATGYTIYSGAFLLVMVPHSIITVSLATAILPRLSAYAADADLPALGREVGSTLRSTYAVIVPLMAVLPVVAHDLASLVFGYGAASKTFTNFVPTLSLFALGLFFFTTHYLMLRGFYALEQTRRVFTIQCAVSAVNIVVAVVLTHGAPAAQIAPRLVVAYTASYAVGATISYLRLSGEVGGLDTPRLVRFAVRMALAVAVATAAAWLSMQGLHEAVGGTGKLQVVVRLVVVGMVELGVVVVLARVLRIRELTEVTGALVRRLSR